MLELLDYILNQKTSEKEYPNGTRDKGRGAVKLSWFLTHKKAQEARLSEAEVSSHPQLSPGTYNDTHSQKGSDKAGSSLCMRRWWRSGPTPP